MSHLFVFRKIRSCLCLITLLVAILESNAQSKLTAKDLDVKKFPTVTGDLWVRNPNGINTDNVRFTEAGSEKEIKPNINGKPKAAAVSKDQKKAVVFLVLNPGLSGRADLEWYKGVIKGAVSSGGVIQKGDKVEIFNYNHSANGQIVYPSSPSFTDDLNAINKKLNQLAVRGYTNLCDKQNAFLTFQAINHTLDILEKQNLKMPTAIYLIGDDRNCTSETNGLESAGPRSLRLNIPVYAVIKPTGGNTLNSIKSLCEETYGLYHQESTMKTGSERLRNYITTLTKRNAGVLYSFEYASEIKKDGNDHEVKITTFGNNAVASGSFLLPVPKRNPVEWIKDHPLWGVMLFVLLAGMTVLFLAFKKKNDKKRKQDLKRHELDKQALEARQRQSDMESQKAREELNNQILRQKEALQAMQQQQRDKELQQLRQKQSEEEKAVLASLTNQMKAKGNFPWFDYILPGAQSTRFEITKPKLVVGRAEGVDLRVDVPTVSKRHFECWFTPQGEYWVKDLGSSNGLYVNGKKVGQALLKHGDFIQAGEAVFNFYI